VTRRHSAVHASGSGVSKEANVAAGTNERKMNCMRVFYETLSERHIIRAQLIILIQKLLRVIHEFD
jgi:hypothetical protein